MSSRALIKSFVKRANISTNHTARCLSTSVASSQLKEANKDNITSPGRAFLDYKRESEEYRAPLERLKDWDEINKSPKEFDSRRKKQAARCMDCGTPFCQSYTGCPLNNLIPEWNNLVHKNDWKNAIDRLHSTNNFPEFTGRVCPAPCEGACVLGIIDDPVTIKNIEYSIVDNAFENGWIQPRIPTHRSGLHVAIIGSGPSGLAAADVLNQYGHYVHVYEREDEIGGLLMYGIPNMKLDKDTLRRRIDLLEQEGIMFHTNQDVNDEQALKLKQGYDAVVLCIGSTVPRNLPQNIQGRDLNGIHFAMEFLTKNQKHLVMNKENGNLHSKWSKDVICAKDKNVIVIGGGDTGCDCIGTAMRQNAKSIINLELMPRPPNTRSASNPWPHYPKILKFDYGHEEVQSLFGYDPRNYQILTNEFVGDSDGNVTGLKTVCVDKQFVVIPGSERVYPADLVLLAMGFVHPEKQIISALDLNINEKNDSFTIEANTEDYKTNVDGVFASGDCRRGQSLVVWAIAEGRGVANSVQKYFKSEGYVN